MGRPKQTRNVKIVPNYSLLQTQTRMFMSGSFAKSWRTVNADILNSLSTSCEHEYTINRRARLSSDCWLAFSLPSDINSCPQLTQRLDRCVHWVGLEPHNFLFIHSANTHSSKCERTESCWWTRLPWDVVTSHESAWRLLQPLLPPAFSVSHHF